MLLISSSAFAEKTRVTLVTTGADERASAFEASLSELLARLKLTLDVRAEAADAGAPEGEALAAVEADFSEPGAVKLTVIDDAGRTVLVRRVTRPGSTQLQAEAAAHVVQSVMEELVAAQQWKPPAVERPPLDVPPLEDARVEVKPEAPQPRWGVDIAAFFGGRTFLNGAPITAGAGGSLAFAYRLGSLRPTLALLADYHLPFQRGDAQIALKLETVSARLLVTLDVASGRLFRIDVGLGGGADVLISAPTAQLPERNLHRRVDADPVITALLVGRLAISSNVDVFLAATVDFDTWPVRFTARSMMGTEPLYQPLWVRPMLVLGFSFNAFGNDPYGDGT